MIPDVILRPDRRTPHGIGASLAALDDRLLVGAAWRDYAYQEDPATDPPCACVYLRDAQTWTLAQSLTAAELRGSEGFGRAVALSPTFADVSAPGHEGGDGPTQGYRWTGRQYERARGFAPPSEGTYTGSYEEYGFALASDDRIVIVGAMIAGPDQAGEVYVFDRATGKRVATLAHPPDIGSFGSAVALAGRTVVVGASAHGLIAKRAGSVFVYDVDTWTLTCRLDGTTLGEGFGAAVSIDGSRIAVGVPGENESAPGRVDVFELRAGACTKLTSIAGGSSFGAAVALRGNRLVVGERRYTAPAGPTWTGRVGLFRLASSGAATHEHWVIPPQAEDRLWFGGSVAIASDYVAASASALRDAASFVGIVWW